MRAIISYKKWWWKFIPKKRRELKIMQAIMDHITAKPEFERKFKEKIRDHLIYGLPIEEKK